MWIASRIDGGTVGERVLRHGTGSTTVRLLSTTLIAWIATEANIVPISLYFGRRPEKLRPTREWINGRAPPPRPPPLASSTGTRPAAVPLPYCVIQRRPAQ